MLRKLKTKVSLILDVLILSYFFLIIYVAVFGGFSVVISGREISATSVYKPAGTLLILYFLKLFVADFKRELEKK